jgi:hypothetical protein
MLLSTFITNQTLMRKRTFLFELSIGGFNPLNPILFSGPAQAHFLRLREAHERRRVMEERLRAIDVADAQRRRGMEERRREMGEEIRQAGAQLVALFREPQHAVPPPNQIEAQIIPVEVQELPAPEIAEQPRQGNQRAARRMRRVNRQIERANRRQEAQAADVQMNRARANRRQEAQAADIQVLLSSDSEPEDVQVIAENNN